MTNPQLLLKPALPFSSVELFRVRCFRFCAPVLPAAYTKIKAYLNFFCELDAQVMAKIFNLSVKCIALNKSSHFFPATILNH